MDFHQIPKIKISQKKRKENQEYLKRIVEESDKSVENRIIKLLNAGYSKEEIENLISF